MPVVTQESRERILHEAEEGARVAARALGTEAKDVENGGYRQMTAAEIDARQVERIERALRYAEWRVAAYEAGDCASPW